MYVFLNRRINPLCSLQFTSMAKLLIVGHRSTVSTSNHSMFARAYRPPASSTFLSEQTSHQQPDSSTLLSEQTSTSHQPPATSHQPPAKRTSKSQEESMEFYSQPQHHRIAITKHFTGLAGTKRLKMQQQLQLLKDHPCYSRSNISPCDCLLPQTTNKN
jgi:hypothetical protein